MKILKSIVLKYNMKNLISKLLPIVKKVNKKINKIKSRVMKKIWSNKKVSKATKNIIHLR